MGLVHVCGERPYSEPVTETTVKVTFPGAPFNLEPKRKETTKTRNRRTAHYHRVLFPAGEAGFTKVRAGLAYVTAVKMYRDGLVNVRIVDVTTGEVVRKIGKADSDRLAKLDVNRDAILRIAFAPEEDYREAA